MVRKTSVTCEFKFCAAHRLIHHPGRCRFVHGHNYRVEVTVASRTALPLKSGMVLDFADLKREIGQWIQQNWDHNLILNANDPMLHEDWPEADSGKFTKLAVTTLERRYGREPFVVPYNAEPTAEVLGHTLMNTTWKFETYSIDTGMRVELEKVRVWETDSCSATVEDVQ